MISDLSPGDKLSLKGKIFELQKKLNIIDIQNKRNEEYSYKPRLYPNKYQLEDRDHSIFESLNQAEAIRRQRKEILKAVLSQQNEEVCTFSPVITKKSQKAISNDNRPVYERLTEKGKIYKDSMEEKRNKFKNYDEHGQKLFIPTINDKEYKNDSISISTAAVDEFLYLDAIDREERFRIRRREKELEAEQLASSSKMNKTSLKLLYKKAENNAKSIFLQIDISNSGSLGVDDIESSMKKLYMKSNKVMKIVEITTSMNAIWTILDPFNIGSIKLYDFVLIITPIIFHCNSPSTALKNVQIAYNLIKNNYKLNANTTASNINNNLNVANSKDEISDKLDVEHIIIFQSFLRDLIASNESSSKKSSSESIPFNPHINDHSYKLALKRELKDKQELEILNFKQRNPSILSVPSIPSMSIPTSSEHSIVSSNDSIPPPPPPSSSCSLITLHDNIHTVNELNKDDNLLVTMNEDNNEDEDDEEDNEMIESDVSCISSHYDLMYARNKLLQKKKHDHIEKLKAEEMKTCSFHPKIKILPKFQPLSKKFTKSQYNNIKQIITERNEINNNNQNNENIEIILQENNNHIMTTKHETDLDEKIFDRLYKEKTNSKKVIEPSKQIIEELQSCTFTPELKHSFSHKKVNNATNHHTDNIPGYEITIKRYRKTYEEKLRKKELDSKEKQLEYQEQKYLKSRELSRKGFIPFNFSLQNREELKKQNENKRLTKPDLIVDIKLSTTKTAKIPIWKGDDASTIVSSFGLIYSLDDQAQQLLIDVIYQSMEQNGLILNDSNDNVINNQLSTSLNKSSKTNIEMNLKTDQSIEYNSENETYSDYSSERNYPYNDTSDIDNDSIKNVNIEVDSDKD